MKTAILIVEDDEGIRLSLEESFTRKGYEVHDASTVLEADRILQERKIDIGLLDVRLPDGSGLDVLATARSLDADIDVIMMTAFPEVKTAVRAMKGGARNYVIKPFDLQELHLNVEQIVEGRELRQTVRHLKREKKNREGDSQLLGESPAMEDLLDRIEKVAGIDTPVLIVGETGTGKELVTNGIHQRSPRRGRPLVKVNCSSFSEQLLESELFGHERGAFTDAKESKPGLFEMADGGTLMLDEISELKLELQARLLRVLDGHPFRRVGGKQEIRTDVRIISSTNRDLQALTQSDRFRKDLYFRLNVFRIELPPLRSRGDDVLLLARSFLDGLTETLRKGHMVLAPSVQEILSAYQWPGNVRELRNVIESAAILCETGEISPEHLPGTLQVSAFTARRAPKGSKNLPSLAEMERCYISHILDCLDGNVSEAARVLGVSRNTLKARLRAPSRTSSDSPL